MRDIRSDLEERAHIIEEQLRAAYAQFDRMAQQLQSERDARLSDLRDAGNDRQADAIRSSRHGQSGDAREPLAGAIFTR